MTEVSHLAKPSQANSIPFPICAKPFSPCQKNKFGKNISFRDVMKLQKM